MLVNASDSKTITQNDINKEICTKTCDQTTFSNENPTGQTSSTFLRQSFAVFGPFMAMLSAGLVFGYSAIMIPQLIAEDSLIRITKYDSSWIASIGAIPMAFGSVLAGYLMELIGRRMLHMVVCVPYIIGWCLIGLAKNFLTILIGRVITGLCLGLLSAAGPVYVGEVTEPKYRGMFLGLITVAFSSGILLTHLIGWFLHWKYTAIISALPPLTCWLMMYFAPESPTWLLSKGETEKAKDGFFWLRSNDEEAKNEFHQMVERNNTLYATKEGKTKQPILEQIKTAFKDSKFLQPLIILLVFFSTLQFSGVNIIIFYTTSVLRDTFNKSVNEFVVMMIIDSVRLGMSTIACICIKELGRRPLALVASFGTAISLISLALFLYFIEKVIGKSDNSFWLPLICLILYVCFTSIGLVPLPWCLIGELLPTAHRGFGSGIITSWNFIAFFIVLKTSPDLFDGLGAINAYIIYGVFTLVGAIYLFIKLPETKNKSLQEIEDEFNKL